MTVHTRQLARLCRERLAAHAPLPLLHEPEQQHAATESTQETVYQHDVVQESEQPVS